MKITRSRANAPKSAHYIGNHRPLNAAAPGTSSVSNQTNIFANKVMFSTATARKSHQLPPEHQIHFRLRGQSAGYSATQAPTQGRFKQSVQGVRMKSGQQKMAHVAAASPAVIEEAGPPIEDQFVGEPESEMHLEDTLQHVEGFELAPGNLYNEASNPEVAKIIQNIQHSLATSQSKQQAYRSTKQRIFAEMKESHAGYIQTLLQGEEDGHCKGIKKRMDPTTRYRL